MVLPMPVPGDDVEVLVGEKPVIGQPVEKQIPFDLEAGRVVAGGWEEQW